MTLLRSCLFILAAVNILLGVYWLFLLAAASGVAAKEPEGLARGFDLAYGWDADLLRQAMNPPEAAESPVAFGRVAAAPVRSVIDTVAPRMLGLFLLNALLLSISGLVLGLGRPRSAAPPPAQREDGNAPRDA